MPPVSSLAPMSVARNVVAAISGRAQDQMLKYFMCGLIPVGPHDGRLRFIGTSASRFALKTSLF